MLADNNMTIGANGVEVEPAPAKLKRIVKKRKPASEADVVIVIPTSEDYNAFLNHKFNSIQLNQFNFMETIPIKLKSHRKI